ncbi:Rpn family recombination-promoting nuclease/putative transposase [bacterium]|nr:Rpn family recombination-promoting nuclease/putative transposase [bacterium]
MNRSHYKDTLFRNYFLEPERLLSICNVLLGTNSNNVDDIVINTLEDNVFSNIRNDLSCIFKNHFMLIVEHQSSINENMPVRMLLYAAELYKRYLSDFGSKFVYRDKLIKLPAPKLFILYNGREKYFESRIMDLADAFGEEGCDINLKVKLLNINDGYNGELLERSRYLKDYCIFVNRVKVNLQTGLKVNAAIRETISYCYKNDIMVDYLSKNEKELFSMMNFEFNLDDAKEVWQEEAREDGLRQGREDGFRQGREDGLRQGKEDGLKQGREEGMARMFETLADLVRDGILTLADAAKRANMTVSEFEIKTGLA